VTITEGSSWKLGDEARQSAWKSLRGSADRSIITGVCLASGLTRSISVNFLMTGLAFMMVFFLAPPSHVANSIGIMRSNPVQRSRPFWVLRFQSLISKIRVSGEPQISSMALVHARVSDAYRNPSRLDSEVFPSFFSSELAKFDLVEVAMCARKNHRWFSLAQEQQQTFFSEHRKGVLIFKSVTLILSFLIKGLIFF